MISNASLAAFSAGLGTLGVAGPVRVAPPAPPARAAPEVEQGAAAGGTTGLPRGSLLDLSV